MTLTKIKIARQISDKTNITNIDSQILFDSFLRLIKDKSKTKVVKISKFGSFFYKYTPKRYGRNPKTGTSHVIKPFNRFVFKTSYALKKNLNWYNASIVKWKKIWKVKIFQRY